MLGGCRMHLIGGILLLLIIFCSALPTPTETITEDENPSVTRLREYLRINSSYPEPDYESCIEWVRLQAEEIGLEFHRLDFASPELFAVWLTWRGLNSGLKSIMLNSHFDVVPADASKWLHDPFAAVKDAEGNIYARGSQDAKSVSVGYLEAIRRLKTQQYLPIRDIHITFVPDEEMGGEGGMQPFVNSNAFKDLNVGLGLDEGGLSGPVNKDEYFIYNAERTTYQFKITATGTTGHGAIMFEDNAAVKLQSVISKLLAYRQEQQDKLANNSTLSIGDVTSINLNRLGGGDTTNVVPSELWAVFDMRIKPEIDWEVSDVQEFLDDVVQSAGPGVRLEMIYRSYSSGVTPVDESDVWWRTIDSTFKSRGWNLSHHYFPASTDSKYLRVLGYPAFGISPFLYSEHLEHQDNEHINEETFLKGVDVYEAVIRSLTNFI